MTALQEIKEHRWWILRHRVAEALSQDSLILRNSRWQDRKQEHRFNKILCNASSHLQWLQYKVLHLSKEICQSLRNQQDTQKWAVKLARVLEVLLVETA